jgi:hypothetical protein
MRVSAANTRLKPPPPVRSVNVRPATEFLPRSRRTRVTLNTTLSPAVSSTAVRWAMPNDPNLPVTLPPVIGCTTWRV